MIKIQDSSPDFNAMHTNGLKGTFSSLYWYIKTRFLSLLLELVLQIVIPAAMNRQVGLATSKRQMNVSILSD